MRYVSLFVLVVCIGCAGTTNGTEVADPSDFTDELYVDGESAYVTSAETVETTTFGSCEYGIPGLPGWLEDLDASGAGKGLLTVQDGDIVITVQMTRPGASFSDVVAATHRRQIHGQSVPFHVAPIGDLQSTQDDALFQFQVTGGTPMRGFVRMHRGPQDRIIAFTAVWESGDHDAAAEAFLRDAADSQVLDCAS